MGVALPLFHARGVFQYSFGLMPYRKPINTVGTTPTRSSSDLPFIWYQVIAVGCQLLSLSSVGKPVSVVQTPSPTSEDIDKLHQIYLQSLTELFEEYKQKYGLEEHHHLTFI